MNTTPIRPANLPQNPIAAAGIAVLTQMFAYYDYQVPVARTESTDYDAAA